MTPNLRMLAEYINSFLQLKHFFLPEVGTFLCFFVYRCVTLSCALCLHICANYRYSCNVFCAGVYSVFVVNCDLCIVITYDLNE